MIASFANFSCLNATKNQINARYVKKSQHFYAATSLFFIQDRLFRYLLRLFAVLVRSYAGLLKKDPVEGTLTFKTTGKCDLANGFVGRDQQVLR